MTQVAKRLPGTENDIFQSHQPFSYPLEQISVPLLVIHGTEDEAVPVENAKTLAAHVPGAQLLL